MGVYDRDYMRPPRGSPGFNLGWTTLAVLGGLAVVAAWWSVNRGAGPWMPPPPAEDYPRPKLLETRTVELGEFEITSGEVAVCDPGYDRGLVREGTIATKVSKVATGTWQARVIHHVIDRPDHVRCGELQAFVASEPVPDRPRWKGIHRDIGVDSGQAGFFDWPHFRLRSAVPADYPWKGKMLIPQQPWYSMCCDVTLHGEHAGVIPYGVVSSSGWGDGGYPAYALRDDAGMIVGLRLVFLTPAEYEPVQRNSPRPGED